MTDSYLESVRNDEIGHICGGLAAIYVTALESQGIPARYVGIFSKDYEPYDSHATVEFWFEGKWYASDPTFNVMFMQNGRYLSYPELYAEAKAGNAYDVTSNSYPLIPGRVIESYYIKLDDLMKFIIIHPSSVHVGGKHYEYPMEVLPAGWDGCITIEGRRVDVRNFSGIYRDLYEGHLR
jgi:hypothetical protein